MHRRAFAGGCPLPIALHRHRYLGKNDIAYIVKESTDIIELNIDEFYQTRIKSLYSDIIDYSTHFISNLDAQKQRYLYGLRTACRDIAEAVKNTKELQQNISKYLLIFLKEDNSIFFFRNKMCFIFYI